MDALTALRILELTYLENLEHGECLSASIPLPTALTELTLTEIWLTLTQIWKKSTKNYQFKN